jgi:type IV pilus assembly protein PilA
MTSFNSRLQQALLKKKKGASITQKGFTLIELLIVVVILGVLSAIGVPAFLNQQKKAEANAANTEVMQSARSCAALQITGEHGSFVPGKATSSVAAPAGPCPASGTPVTFTVAAVPAKHTVAAATIDGNGGVSQVDATGAAAVAVPQ